MAESKQERFSSVEGLLKDKPAIDNTAVFEQFRAIQDELFAKIWKRFALSLDESTQAFQPYASLDGKASGKLHAFSGREMDWLIYSWVGNPAQSFCNMHLTAWLGPQTWAPHLAFAFGTFPVMFFLMDLVPRKDVTIEAGYLKRYLEPQNAAYLRMREDPRIQPFVSRTAFVRAAVSPVGLNFISPPGTEGVIDIVRTEAHRTLDLWLDLVESAEKVAPKERAALAARDLAFRKNAAELDPANVVVEGLYGKELTQGLVRALWGGDRVSARPGGAGSKRGRRKVTPRAARPKGRPKARGTSTARAVPKSRSKTKSPRRSAK